MLRYEQKVVDIISRLLLALEQGSLELKDFPVEDIVNLIDSALGGAMWNGIGSRPQEVFPHMVEEYRMGLARCIELNDVGRCIQILRLLVCQYQCFYTAMGREEQLHREKTLRSLLLKTGNAYAEAQSRALQQRQEGWRGEKNLLQSGKGAVYTCLVKGEGQLPLPEYRNVLWDYICFTDRKDLDGKKAGAWEFRLLSEEDMQHPADAYYKYKVKPYEMLGEYDFSFWVEPQVQIAGPLEQFYEIYGRNASFVCFPSYDQDDLYDALAMSMTEDEENIRRRRKLMQYRKEGFPAHYGLINTQLMFRSHRDEGLKRVMEDWWREMHDCKALVDYGFSYAAWKNGFRYALCGLFAESNQYIVNGDIDLEVDIYQ